MFLGSELRGKLYFSHEDGVQASFGERLREVVGLHAPVCHAVVDDTVRALFERHTQDFAAHDVRLASVRAIRSSRFEFSYRAYAPRYAEEIRALLAGRPEGVTLEGGEPREHVDQAGVGLEAYTPAHQYEAEGAGAISGRIDLVIETHHRLTSHPLVKVERIGLDLE
jgi:hypothetical protein